MTTAAAPALDRSAPQTTVTGVLASTLAADRGRLVPDRADWWTATRQRDALLERGLDAAAVPHLVEAHRLVREERDLLLRMVHAARGRHVPAADWEGRFCTACGQVYPCPDILDLGGPQ